MMMKQKNDTMKNKTTQELNEMIESIKKIISGLDANVSNSLVSELCKIWNELNDEMKKRQTKTGETK